MKAIFQIAQCRISYAKLRFYFETNKDLSKKVASKIWGLTFCHTGITNNVGDVRWFVVAPYAFYCHSGSFSQPEGKPRAALSISGNVAKRLFILSSISLFGEIISRKYLMMHISKYTFKGSVGKVIQGRDILTGMVARIENTLFHTREWWQHEFLVTVITVSQDSKGATCKPNDCAIRFFIFLFLMLE